MVYQYALIRALEPHDYTPALCRFSTLGILQNAANDRLASILGAFHFLAFACLMVAQLFRLLA
jgi:hypothetical protein